MPKTPEGDAARAPLNVASERASGYLAAEAGNSGHGSAAPGRLIPASARRR
jgi:hypothetical protein